MKFQFQTFAIFANTTAAFTGHPDFNYVAKEAQTSNDHEEIFFYHPVMAEACYIFIY